MDLNERKVRILELIINDYIASAEPIGSRTIAKKYDLGISSATIRNEMSDLEEMGYIIAPHTSSGRVPSDKGYRLYVDRLMREKELSQDERIFLRKTISNNITQIDYLMKETAKAISILTNYTSVVSEAVVATDTIQHLQLMPLDDSSILLAIVTNSKKVKNYTLRVHKTLDYATLNKLTYTLNASLKNLGLSEIDEDVVKKLQQNFLGYDSLFRNIISVIVNSLNDDSKLQVYTSGIKNILTFPEFSDLVKARAIFETLEEKNLIVMLLGSSKDCGIDISIGQENGIIELKDCSIIRANYSLGGDSYGSIGIIGPTRMDYSQAVSVLHSIVKNINIAIKALEDG